MCHVSLLGCFSIGVGLVDNTDDTLVALGIEHLSGSGVLSYKNRKHYSGEEHQVLRRQNGYLPVGHFQLINKVVDIAFYFGNH